MSEKVYYIIRKHIISNCIIVSGLGLSIQNTDKPALEHFLSIP